MRDQRVKIKKKKMRDQRRKFKKWGTRGEKV
jgi:hypothetical protein